MSNCFLHLVLSVAGERALLQCGQLRTTISKQFSNKSVFSTKKFTSSVIRTGNNTHNQSTMPIIPAVIAHRHFYHHQQQLLQRKATSPPLQFVYPFDLKTNGISINNSDCLDSYVTVFAARSSISGSLFPRAVPVDMTQMGYPHKESRRSYAKGKDRVKNKKAIVSVNEEEIRAVIDYDAFKNQMEQLIDQMKDEFVKHLNIRGASGALELLPVEFDGETYPLQELAQVGRKNPQLAVLNLSSLPEACQAVMKAIQDCGMNLNPQQEGTTIYVALPKVTREHRENLAKNAKTIFVKYKTSFQGVQNRYIKQCKSHKELSDDLLFSVHQQIMKITESYVAEADKLVLAKQKELLETK